MKSLDQIAAKLAGYDPQALSVAAAGAFIAELVQPVAGSEDQPSATKAARGFWLQLGAFRERDGAVGFRQRVAQQVEGLGPLLAIFQERNLHRLQAGPYASRADANQAAERLRAALSLVPTVVERR